MKFAAIRLLPSALRRAFVNDFSNAKQRWPLYSAEPLESRRLLNAVFTPVFGNETFKQDGGQRVDHPAVVLVFWGSYWGSATSAAANTVANAADELLDHTNYFSVTAQYGTSGSAYLSTRAYVASPNPVNGKFDHNDIDSVISTAISSGQIGTYSNGIYEVVTPPGVSSSATGDTGFNFEDSSRVEAWLSTGSGPAISTDQLTLSMGHETVEAMTDPGGNGYEVNPGASWPADEQDGNQICDYEAESYRFREPNGVLVQPIWSMANKDWEVADGNSQRFDYKPVWSGNNFDFEYNVVLNGDQVAANHNDTFSVSTTGTVSPLVVTMNGQSELPQEFIKTITINTGNGTNTVDLYQTELNTTVTVNNGGPDTVNLGLGNTRSIESAITLTNSASTTTLNLNDSADTTARTITITSSSISGITPLPIDYTASKTRAINLTTGTKADTVNVNSTSVPTSLNSSGGEDSVNVGLLSTNGIAGTLNISNTPDFTNILIDDVLDTTSRTVTVTPSSVTGLAPAAINFVEGDVQSLKIFTGFGSTSSNAVTINVTGTPASRENPTTSIQTSDNTSGRSNLVQITGTGGALNINGNASPLSVFVGTGSLTSVQGKIDITDKGGSALLFVNDSKDTTARSATLSSSSLSWSNYAATVDWTATATSTGGVTSLLFQGGSGGNTFTVSNAPDFFSDSYLNTGSGNDTINVQNTSGTLLLHTSTGNNIVNVGSTSNSVAGIKGQIYIDSTTGGTTTLNVNDSGDSTAKSVTLTNSMITGLAPASIQYVAPEVNNVNIKLGNGSDSMTVSSLSAATKYNLNGGGETNTLIGPNLANSWNVTGPNQGTLNSTVTFSNFQNLQGNHVSDDFALSSAGSITGTIAGGNGAETLDYSSRSTGVSVNLAMGAATSTGGVSKITNVIGTTGNDNLTAAKAGSTITANGGADSLTGGAGNDTFVLSTSQKKTTTINGGGGSNTIDGANANTTWRITGNNNGTVNGALFSNIQNLTGARFPNSFVFGANGQLSGNVAGGGLFEFGIDTDSIDETAKTTPIKVNLANHTASNLGSFSNIGSFFAGSGNNTLTGDKLADTFVVEGKNGGSVTNSGGEIIVFNHFANLVGGSAANRFEFSAKASLTGTITGNGTAKDWLDYSAYKSPVSVNLATGAATGTAGISGIENVLGSADGNTLVGNAFGNVLIGGSDNDTIAAGAGRSILIGDAGADSLTGGPADDILISGTTSYDSNFTALQSILAEWKSNNKFTTRINDLLLGTGLDDAYKLIWGSTVLGDNFADTLTGGGGDNWFFKGTKDTITDLHSSDQVN